MNYFETSAWPLRIGGFHACASPLPMLLVLKPILFALKDKESRSRTVFHDGTESEIIAALSEYGINKDMLPTEMGGSLVFRQSEWIDNRRAAELEEI